MENEKLVNLEPRLAVAQQPLETDICEVALNVIEIEAEMIASLNTRIDKNFIAACQYLYRCVGRIAVMGIGKSGHIGKKIAATFASTGSPAFFVHPSEARHGDIGMLTRQDALVILSNSGETEEILSMLAHFKRLDIPIIALTGRPQSTLGKAATVAIDVSVSKEACPLGLAPTSSTTAALVMGDAVAMALLRMRKFTEKDFALSHPGGALGRRLLLCVDELMHTQTELPLVKDSATLKEALVEMTRKKLGMTSIVNHQGKLVGIFTDGDVRRAFEKDIDLNTTGIQSVMSKNPKTIAADILAVEALNIMQSLKITSLIIINDAQQPVGIIHIHDLLRAGLI